MRMLRIDGMEGKMLPVDSWEGAEGGGGRNQRELKTAGGGGGLSAAPHCCIAPICASKMAGRKKVALLNKQSCSTNKWQRKVSFSKCCRRHQQMANRGKWQIGGGWMDGWVHGWPTSIFVICTLHSKPTVGIGIGLLLATINGTAVKRPIPVGLTCGRIAGTDCQVSSAQWVQTTN